ncbi:MAG: dihydrofolate reductase [Armatimonadetes bacterium]|nr:dihydrofolate reductase [Armatimonadota bacterium]
MISLVVAMDENNLIGREGGLPWRMPCDLKHFRKVTMGKPVIMGRKTWESIGRALDGRLNVVISRNADFRAESATVTDSLEAALRLTADAAERAIIGGAVLFSAALPIANRIHLTRIHHRFEGDTWFPEISSEDWKEVESRACVVDEKNPHPHTFLTLDRAAVWAWPRRVGLTS